MTPEEPLTFRCSICAFNWPYRVDFAKCPICDEPCAALRLEAGSEVLTITDANEMLAELGLPTVYDPDARRRVVVKKPPLKREPSQSDLETLYHDLDSWAHGAPPWAR